jgi:glycosyltransferase involved in cell wall biosynthesis
MHIALNAWFWDRTDTGSGQYLRGLVNGLKAVSGHLTLSLIAPEGASVTPPEGVNLQTVALKGSGHLAKVRFEQQGFPRAAAKIGADLVHIPFWAAPLDSPLPIVVTIHDLIPLLLPQYRGGVLARLYTALVAASARGAAAVITDSEHSRKDILANLRLPPERVHTVLLAVGDDYHPRQGSLLDMGIAQKYDLPPEYVLYVGGFDVRKNIETLIKAFTYVKDGVSDLHNLVIAGRLPDKKSPRFADVKALVKEMNVEDVVRFIGPVDEADKPAVYRMAKCFVFPSRYEGFGLPVLEAMACGTPVVAADSSSVPEITGDAAFLVPPDDARHMAGSILALLVQENVSEDLKKKSLARAALFSWAKTAAETARIYQKVLDAP